MLEVKVLAPILAILQGTPFLDDNLVYACSGIQTHDTRIKPTTDTLNDFNPDYYVISGHTPINIKLIFPI
jgi:hypothetical protein